MNLIFLFLRRPQFVCYLEENKKCHKNRADTVDCTRWRDFIDYFFMLKMGELMTEILRLLVEYVLLGFIFQQFVISVLYEPQSKGQRKMLNNL